MESNQVSFIIPCYNESPQVLNRTVSTLQETLNSISSLRYEIVIVNDGSDRHTYPDFSDDRVRMVNHRVRRGYGASLLSGMGKAQHGWIGIVDADGTYPVEYFKELLQHMDEFDMVVGKRSWKDIEPIKRLPKLVLHKLSGFLSGCEVQDLNSGMRLFKRELVDNHVRIFPSGFSFTSTLTMICFTNGRAVKHIDIPYYSREGLSHIKPVKDTVKFFTLLLRLSLYFNPLRFFVPLSFMIGAAAVLRGIRDVLLNNFFGGLTLVLFFMAFQIFFFGLIAEIINKK